MNELQISSKKAVLVMKSPQAAAPARAPQAEPASFGTIATQVGQVLGLIFALLVLAVFVVANLTVTPMGVLALSLFLPALAPLLFFVFAFMLARDAEATAAE